MKYIIIYDIPKEKKVLQVQVNRALKSIKAEKIQHSVWESDDLKSLKILAAKIKNQGGEAILLEKKVISD
jgi:CRISPR/Cas system-associated endoribonuclease Cas2